MPRRKFFPSGYLSFVFLVVLFACGAGFLADVYCSLLKRFMHTDPGIAVPLCAIALAGYSIFGKITTKDIDEKRIFEMLMHLGFTVLIFHALLHGFF